MNEAHEPLRVLTLAKALLVDVYTQLALASFDKHIALRDQLMRATLSVASNIAEGDGRPGTKDGVRFFGIATASAEEAKVQIELAAKIGALDSKKAIELYEGYSKVCRMLNKLSEIRLNRLQ